jgi:hypothetical protein
MAYLAELPELVGFFSYSRDDDEDSHGALSALRERIQRELRGQLGRSMKTFRLWQDKEAIAAGKLWEAEIKTAVGQSVFFIPIITPTVVRSPHCRFELEAFLAREAELGRDDLVFPILYIRVPELEDAARQKNDPVLSIIAKRQYLDWREFRHRDVHSTDVKEAVERFCTQICETLRRYYLAPDEREAQETEAALRKEEAERQRREAEAKRREEEERKARETEAALQQAEAERQQREAEAKRREEEERKAREAEAASQQAETERKQREAETKRREEEERRKAGLAQARERAEEDRRRAEQAHAEDERRRTDEQRPQNPTTTRPRAETAAGRRRTGLVAGLLLGLCLLGAAIAVWGAMPSSPFQPSGQTATIDVQTIRQNLPLPNDIPIDPDVLALVQTDRFFLNAPPIRVTSYQLVSTSDTGDFTMTLTSTLRPIGAGIAQFELSQKFGTIDYEHVGIEAGNGSFDISQRIEDVNSGSINKTTYIQTRFERLKGNLFPVAIGNELSSRTVASFSPDEGSSGDMIRDSSCNAIEKRSASEFYRGLPGDAYVLQCKETTDFAKNPNPTSKDSYTIYFSKLGYFLSVDTIDPNGLIGEKGYHTVLKSVEWLQ